MLDARTQDFASRERFVDAVLGLLSLTETVRALATHAPHPPAPRTTSDDGLADFLLGLVSVGRSLRATLDLAGTAAAPVPEPAPADVERPTRILR